MGEFVWEDGNETKTKRERDVYIFRSKLLSHEHMNTWTHGHTKIEKYHLRLYI
jgi:hypothetical protein